MIVCRNGVLRLDTGAFDRHQPGTYARRHIGATFTPGETCPVFERLLASMFCDRRDADRTDQPDPGVGRRIPGDQLAVARTAPRAGSGRPLENRQDRAGQDLCFAPG